MQQMGRGQDTYVVRSSASTLSLKLQTRMRIIGWYDTEAGTPFCEHPEVRLSLMGSPAAIRVGMPECT